MNKHFETRAIARHSAVMISMILAAAAARAQEATLTNSPTEAAGMLEEVVVTAQKREERLQDVPVAVAAVGAAPGRAPGQKQQEREVSGPHLSPPRPAAFTCSAVAFAGVPNAR